MAFPSVEAQPCCVRCPRPPRAALVLAPGCVAHLCVDHLLEMLGPGTQTYPVLELVGAALRPPAAPGVLRLVVGGG